MNRRYYCLLIVLFFAVLIQAAAAERTYNILFIQSYRLSLKPWGIALKFLFLHHENILFPND